MPQNSNEMAFYTRVVHKTSDLNIPAREDSAVDVNLKEFPCKATISQKVEVSDLRVFLSSLSPEETRNETLQDPSLFASSEKPIFEVFFVRFEECDSSTGYMLVVPSRTFG